MSKQKKKIDEYRDRLKTKGFANKEWDLESTVKSLRDTYFELLDIPEKYKEFVWSMVYFTVKKDISISSVEKTKVATAIYILSISCDDIKNSKGVSISKDEIQKECNVSKSTFMRFFNDIKSFLNSEQREKCRKQFIHIFNKHKIPLDKIITKKK